MKLTEIPEIIQWTEMHYLFIEKKGSFMETAPKAWQELHQKMSELKLAHKITGAMSLYQIQPEMIYRAGVSVEARPEKTIPDGMNYQNFKGGTYARFTLQGSYSQLPEACGKVFEIVKKINLPLRDDFFIENYVNDPNSTPEEQLITEILVPCSRK